METEKIKMAFEKVVELRELIGDGATLWEMGFIARYVKFQEDENSALSMEQHVKQAKKLMRSMLNIGLVVDKSEELAKKVFPEKFSGKSIVTDESTAISEYANHIAEIIFENGKNDGNHVASLACGSTNINGIQYEIRIVFEPRKETWLGEEGKVDFLNIQG